MVNCNRLGHPAPIPDTRTATEPAFTRSALPGRQSYGKTSGGHEGNRPLVAAPNTARHSLDFSAP
jgi:hypothetical protein